jgi:hypothetical protein
MVGSLARCAFLRAVRAATAGASAQHALEVRSFDVEVAAFVEATPEIASKEARPHLMVTEAQVESRLG